ncbi:MAG: 16S rRNA (guanine(966)-N(2))-methyltransferase RsmD [Candidatus Saccharimonadales bacterium]
MNLRIIAGRFGGRTIKAPTGRVTHPMSDRVRGSLFNMINNRLDGADVLDIFAGTGSLGLEALSRGAEKATFVERDRIASRILDENIKLLGVSDVTEATQIGASTWIDKNPDKRFDIIFADPPYDDMQLGVVTRLGGLLKPGGMLVLSHPEKAALPEIEGLEVVEDRGYGGAWLRLWKKI